MATLEKIRSKAGLLVITIGIALLAFIVGDLLNSSQSFLRSSEDNVVVIDGKKINSTDFFTRVDEMTEVYKLQSGEQNINAEMSQQIYQNVYEALLREELIGNQAKEIGMVVSKEELDDMVNGEHIAPVLQQIFANPQTRQFDRTLLQNFLQNIYAKDENGQLNEQLASQRAFWMFWEKSIKQQRLESKYNTLLAKAIMPNKLDIQAAIDGAAKSVDFVWARQPYTTIADSTVIVDQKQLKKLYDAQKENFKQEEKRIVKYFSVDIKPSESDFIETNEKISILRDEFATTTDIAEVVNPNSDVAYVDAFTAISALPAEIKTFANTAEINAVEGPFLSNNSYKMFRLIGRTVAPDSMKTRHIMLPINDMAKSNTLADSIVKALKGGADFALLAGKYSMDQTAQTGGDLGWVTDEMALRGLGEEFRNAIFSAKGSDIFTIKSMYGLHIAQVTDRTAAKPKAKVAQIVMEVTPSSKTFNTLYNDINQYIALNNDAEKFEAAAAEKGYNILTNAALTANDFRLGAINEARVPIRWAFNADKGTVSQIYEINNKFVVVALVDITKEGYAPLSEVADRLKADLIATKKGEMIIEKLKAAAPSSLDAYAQAMQTSVDTAKFVNFNTRSISGMGFEPAINAISTTTASNQLSTPVIGKNGVYVLSVYNTIPNENPIDAKAQQQQLESSIGYRIQYQAFDILRSNAEIKDSRIKFF